MNQCALCGAPTPQSYTAFLDSTQKAKPDSKYLTGKSQILSARSGQTSTYSEYEMPVCRKCVYLSQIRFNLAAAVIAGLVGAALFTLLSAKAWAIPVFLFCAGNAAFGVNQFAKYINDRPNENGAVSALSGHYNNGLPSGSRAAWYTHESLHSDIGKLGALTQASVFTAACAADNDRYCHACHRSDLKLFYTEHPEPTRDAISLRCVRCGGTVCQHCKSKLKRYSDAERDGQLCPVCGQYTIFEYTGKKDYSDLLRQAEMRYGSAKG